MRRTMTEFSDQEKALMLDILIDQIIDGYEKEKPKDFKYHSVAEMVGYRNLISLNESGFITPEGILGN